MCTKLANKHNYSYQFQGLSIALLYQKHHTIIHTSHARSQLSAITCIQAATSRGSRNPIATSQWRKVVCPPWRKNCGEVWRAHVCAHAVAVGNARGKCTACHRRLEKPPTAATRDVRAAQLSEHTNTSRHCNREQQRSCCTRGYERRSTCRCRLVATRLTQPGQGAGEELALASCWSAHDLVVCA